MLKGQEVDSFFNRMVEDSKFSAAVLVADRSGIVMKGGYGQANDASGTPMTPDIILDIGSISKQFTATAILGQSLGFSPGGEYAYSNSGYTLLAAIRILHFFKVRRLSLSSPVIASSSKPMMTATPPKSIYPQPTPVRNWLMNCSAKPKRNDKP